MSLNIDFDGLSFLSTRWTLTFESIAPAITCEQLRSAMLFRYRRSVCPKTRWRDECDNCPLLEGCSYGQTFATRPTSFQALSAQAKLARPYLLRTDENRRNVFTLTLIGAAAALYPRFSEIFSHLGESGLDRTSPEFQISHTAELRPDGAKRINRGEQPKPLRASEWVATEEYRTETRIRFLTPTKLKDQGRQIDTPSPIVVVKRLRDRMSTLASAWCGGEPPWDFLQIAEAAEHITLKDDSTRWHKHTHRSGTSRQTISLSGFTGTATWSNIPEELWPILVIGQHLGVGKGCVFGNGWYRLES